MDDLVDDRTAVRVDPYDVSALGAAIRSLIAAPERRAAMVAAATERGPQLDINERARRVTEWLSGLLPHRRTEQD